MAGNVVFYNRQAALESILLQSVIADRRVRAPFLKQSINDAGKTCQKSMFCFSSGKSMRQVNKTVFLESS